MNNDKKLLDRNINRTIILLIANVKLLLSNLTNRKWIEGNTVENLIESNNSFSNVIFLAFLRRNI